MNEKAIQDAYNLFIQGGYGKSIDEFKKLIATNPNALNDSYNLFKSNGYTKSVDEYKSLMGVSSIAAQPTIQPIEQPAQEPIDVKKKEQLPIGVAALPSAPSSLGLQNQPSPFDTTPLGNVKAAPIIEKKPTDFLEPSLDTITPELINKNEEFVVPKMNYQFGDLGFKFEESGMTGDWMTATAPNGKTIEVSLDPFFNSKAESESQRLKQFIKENSAEVKGLSAIERSYAAENKKFDTQKEVDESIKRVNSDATSLNQEMGSFLTQKKQLDAQFAELSKTPQQLKNTPEYLSKSQEVVQKQKDLEQQRNQLVTRQGNIESQGKALDKAIGRYTDMKESQSAWYEIPFIALAKGVGSLASGFYGMSIDAMNQYAPKEMLMDSDWWKSESIRVAKDLGIGEPSIGQSEDKWLNSLTQTEKDKIENKVRDSLKKRDKYLTVGGEAQDPEFIKSKYIEFAEKEGIKGPKSDSKEDYYKWLNTISDSKKSEFDKKITEIATGGTSVANLLRNSLSNALPVNTTEESYNKTQQGFVGGAITGALESVPSFALGGAVSRLVRLFAQSEDATMRDMENNPAFKDISENEKRLVSAPISIATAVLEEFGFRNVIESKGLLNGVVGRALGKSGASTTSRSFAEFVRNDVDNMIARGALKLVGGALAEAETGALQQANQLAVEKIYNEVKSKEMYKLPEDAGGVIADILKSGAQEAIGGFVLGMPSAVSAAYTKKGFLGMNDATFKAFQAAANDENIQKAFVTKLKNQVNQGEVTIEQAKETLNNYRNSVGLFKSMPDNLDIEGQKNAMNLLKEKRDLENQIIGKDAALVQPQKDRINAINESLTKLSQDAIQKQSTNESLLRTGQPQLGLQQMGEGNAQPQVVTTGTQEVTPEGGTQEVVKPLEHKENIHNKFREVFESKGVPKEQVDGAIALMEARAKSWASEEKGRNADDWYEKISDVSNGDFQSDKILYQDKEGKKTNVVRLYHSTTSPISGDFRVKGKNNSHGIFFAAKKAYSKVFGDITYKVKIEPKNTLVLNDNEVAKTPFFNIKENELKDYLDKGYDSIAWNKGGKLQEFIVLDNSIIKDRDIVYQKNKGEAKGAVETLADGKKVIHALDAPDFSTMVHEISHVFEGDLTEAEKKIVKDFGGSEPFARGFEKYLRDGKSPSPELETLFGKFKEWLTNIYQTLKGSPIAKKISPEIKNIFDRLLTEKQTPKEEVKVEISKEEVKSTKELEIPADLQERGEPIESTLEAERRRSNGERIFAMSEQDETPVEVTSIEMLRSYTPDQLIAYKPIQTQEVSSKTQAPRFVRDISALITPATVRGFSPLTERIKKLSLNYDKLVKEYGKKKDKKILSKIKKAEAQILNDAKQEIVDAVSNIDGVSVQFKDNKRGLWAKKFEPSFNMILSISPQADTKKVSDLLFDFAEKYSQDAFILETESELHDEWVNGNIDMPLTEIDENKLQNYPQIIYTFAEPITDEQVAELSESLENQGVEAFNINNNEIQVSVITFLPENNNLTKEEQYNEKLKDFQSKSSATANAVGEILGSNALDGRNVIIKKSSYQGAVNEDTEDQTRQYDRSDVLKAFQESTTKVEELAVELANLRQKEIDLQKEGKKLSPEEQTRFNELVKKVQPAVQRTFEANKKLYEDSKIEVEGIAQDAIAEVDASISPFPIKRAERASVKAIRWYNAFTEKLGDGSRVNIVVDTDANADKVFKIIDEKYPGDTETRRITETTDLGYPKRLIEIRTSNGTLAEIQVITNEAYLAKDGIRGFTGDQNQKNTAKQKLDEVRARLGWNIPDGLGHYFYEIQRDINVDKSLADEAARLSDLYYDAFMNPNSKLTESFMKDVMSFKEKVDAADKSKWDVGNKGIAPQSLIDYTPTNVVETAPAITAPVVEEQQYEPITADDIHTDAFTRDNASTYEEDYREADNGRSYPYLSSLTIEATNADGDTVGNITKITDEDRIFSFNIEDADGNEFEGYDTLGEAKKALADKWNKIKQKEFNKEAKRKAKEAQKAAEKLAKKEAKKAATTIATIENIDSLLDLDVTQKDNLDKVFDALDNLDKNINKKLLGGANDAMLAIPLGTVQLVVKTLKALVKGGMVLRDAIKKVAADNNISQDTIKDIINISPIQDGFNTLMGKVDELIARQKTRGIDDAKIVRNLDTYIRNSDVYNEANDAQKKIMEREGRTKMGAPERIAPSIGRILGVLKDITNVSRQDKLKIISQIRQLSKDAAKELAKEIRDIASTGKISVNQAANIVARFGKVNMLSGISVSKFVDYMTKVFANAEYASKLNEANSLKKDISKLSKDKEKNANLRDLAQQFVKIDPSMVEDIDAYNEMASKVKEAIKGSTIRVQKVSFAETVNIENASKYIDKIIKAQNEKIRQEKAEEIQDLMGIDVSDFSYDDMMSLLDIKKPITEYNEGIIRGTIQKMFNIYSSIINETINTGKDQFNDEDVEFTQSQKDLVKSFMAINLTSLRPKQALQAVDALANFLQNHSTAKMQSVVSNYTGIAGAKEISQSNIKASQLKKYNIPLLGRVLGENFTNLNILFERMFKGFRVAGKVMDKMGFTKLVNNVAFATKQSNNIIDRYVNEFYKRQANGEAYNTQYNNTERGLAAFMMRNVIGTAKEVQNEFNRRKNLIKESIKVLSEGNEQEKKKSELYQQVYDKIFSVAINPLSPNQVLGTEPQNAKEISERIDKTNLEGINFWFQEWLNKYDEMADVSLNIYNKILEKELNYTPDRFFKLSTDTENVELSNDDSSFHYNNGTLYKKESSGLMVATKPEKLPINEDNGNTSRYIDLSFDNNNSNSMYDALSDIHTAAPIRQIEGFLNSKYFKDIIPQQDDATILENRIDLYVKNIRNKNPYSSDEVDKVIKRLNRIAAIGVGQALGGPTQVIKQVFPVAWNTIINAGGLDVLATFNDDKNNFIENSGYAIANRGVESQAQIQSINRLIDEAAKSKGEKLFQAVEKANQFWLKNFLVNADVYIAKASWLTYYEQELKRLGLYETTIVDKNTASGNLQVSTPGINYKTHKLNKEAANYAQRMVDRQQNVSDSDLAGKIFSSKDAKTQAFVKGLMPFASFRMNQSARLGADIATLTSKVATAEDKKIAIKSLSGYAVEAAIFRMLGIGISTLLGGIVLKAMGKDEDDEEKKKRIDAIIKGARTGTFTDVFSPLPLLDKIIQKGGAVLLNKIEKETELPVSIYGATTQDIAQGLGLFGIAAERLTQTAELGNLVATGTYTDMFGKEKTISEKNREALSMFIVPSVLSNFGLVPTEVNTAVRYAIKDAKKKDVSPEEKEAKVERAAKKEDENFQKFNALQKLREKAKSQEEMNAIDEKISLLEATPEEKKAIQEDRKAEKEMKQYLLTNPETGKKYDNENELKRYNPKLYKENFGTKSDWYEEHKDDKDVQKKLNKEIRKMEDVEEGYVAPTKTKTTSKRNSDGTLKSSSYSRIRRDASGNIISSFKKKTN